MANMVIATVHLDDSGRSITIPGVLDYFNLHHAAEDALPEGAYPGAFYDLPEEAQDAATRVLEHFILTHFKVTHVVCYESFENDEPQPVSDYLSK